jgi:Fe-S oxidoreductase
MYPPADLEAFARVKALFDPDNLLNPGVLVDPHALTEDLRVPNARPAEQIAGGRREVLPGLAFPADDDLTAAVHRCVGVGACRSEANAVMCPSYLATGDEKDSTRGRARVLQEMANGGLITGGWSADEVLESLDLCLSCKGCAVDCPAGVDMATYKAEFTDRHYRGRIRPRSHYTLGRLAVWARLASKAPRFANGGMRLFGRAVKATAGIDRRRTLPTFAGQTFRQWFGGRDVPAGTGEPVVLWVDTFTEYLDPAVGRAAVQVLEHLGFRVAVPAKPVCCGLTWLSTGQLDRARRRLRASLDAIDEAASSLDPTALQHIPVLGLEPSCTALLRDDAARLLPGDPRAAALHSRVTNLAGLLGTHRPDWKPAMDTGRAPAIVQEHCHQHASTGFAADRALLENAGLDPTVLSGCCGLAGNFGVERGHYDVSTAIAEHALLPALRNAASGTTVVADGFSCRTQAEQLAGVRSRHLAQVLADALQSSHHHRAG